MVRDSKQVRSDQKLATMGLLTGSVAHDFNNLLTAILGYTELLSAHLHDEKLSGYAGAVLNAGEQAREMVRRLVSLTEPSRGVAQCRVNRVVSETESVLDRIVGGQVDILLALDPRVRSGLADPADLQQVVMNLVVNARDAMEGAGVVGIESSLVIVSEAQGEALEISPGSYVVVRVSDTGSGMDLETQARVFEPFFTTKGAAGTGLGLATVKRIAERWGGAVEIESVPAEGTSIAIYIPTPDPTAEAGPPSAVHSVLCGEPKRRSHEGDETILVVDDDPLVYGYICEVLTAAGYRVLGSTDPVEAWEIALDGGHRIDALVSDLEMPGMNGVQLAERVRGLGLGAAVLFVSGSDQCSEGDELLAKPFDRRSLLSRVRRVLRPRRTSMA